MDPGRRGLLAAIAGAATSGCTWTSRWEAGDRPEELRQNRTGEPEPVCEEWVEEPGNLTVTVEAPPIMRVGRDDAIVVRVRNDGVGDECFVRDVTRDSDNATVRSLAFRVPPGREQTVRIPVSGAGPERYRIGEETVSDEVLLVPGPHPFGESARLGGIAVTVEDLVFRGSVDRSVVANTRRAAVVDAPDGEVFAFARIAATGIEDGACACVYGDVELVTAGSTYEPVPDAGVLESEYGPVRVGNLGGRFGALFVNRPAAAGETVEGWVPFQVPAGVADRDPLVRIGDVGGPYWAPE